jgi:hypothetical protein
MLVLSVTSLVIIEQSYLGPASVSNRRAIYSLIVVVVLYSLRCNIFDVKYYLLLPTVRGLLKAEYVVPLLLLS